MPRDTYIIDRYMETKANSEPTDDKDGIRELSRITCDILSEDEENDLELHMNN